MRYTLSFLTDTDVAWIRNTQRFNTLAGTSWANQAPVPAGPISGIPRAGRIRLPHSPRALTGSTSPIWLPPTRPLLWSLPMGQAASTVRLTAG